MLTGKDRVKLRTMAQKIDPLIQIGKGGISENLLDSASNILDKRELLKVKLLRNADIEKEEAATALCQLLKAELVQQIGNVLVLYRRSDKKGVVHIL